MKQDMNPVAVVGVIVVLVALIVVFGFRALKPAPYTPSPGVLGDKGPVPGSTSPTASPTVGTSGRTYSIAPEGSMPGRPVNSGN